MIAFQNAGSRLLVRNAVGGGALHTVPELRTILNSDELVLPASQAVAAVSNSGRCFGYLKFGQCISTGLPEIKGRKSVANTSRTSPRSPTKKPGRWR